MVLYRRTGLFCSGGVGVGETAEQDVQSPQTDNLAVDQAEIDAQAKLIVSEMLREGSSAAPSGFFKNLEIVYQITSDYPWACAKYEGSKCVHLYHSRPLLFGDFGISTTFYLVLDRGGEIQFQYAQGKNDKALCASNNPEKIKMVVTGSSDEEALLSKALFRSVFEYLNESYEFSCTYFSNLVCNSDRCSVDSYSVLVNRGSYERLYLEPDKLRLFRERPN
jgi:hypothetical protein